MGNINDIARFIILAFFKLGLAIVAVIVGGCTQSDPEAPTPSPTPWPRDSSVFTYQTSTGKPVEVWRDGENLTFEIRAGDGSEFGFSLRGDGFEEWAVVEGVRETLQVEYRAELDVEIARFNGQVIQVTRADQAAYSSFETAFNTMANPKRPIEESSLYHNDLGEELVLSLGTTLHDIGVQQRWVNDDGTCSASLSSVAGACARFKCMAGGWGNPLCHVCVGTTAVCAIIALVDLLGGE